MHSLKNAALHNLSLSFLTKKEVSNKDFERFFQRSLGTKHKVPSVNLPHVFNDEWKPLCNEKRIYYTQHGFNNVPSAIHKH